VKLKKWLETEKQRVVFFPAGRRRPLCGSLSVRRATRASWQKDSAMTPVLFQYGYSPLSFLSPDGRGKLYSITIGLSRTSMPPSLGIPQPGPLAKFVAVQDDPIHHLVRFSFCQPP